MPSRIDDNVEGIASPKIPVRKLVTKRKEPLPRPSYLELYYNATRNATVEEKQQLLEHEQFVIKNILTYLAFEHMFTNLDYIRKPYDHAAECIAQDVLMLIRDFQEPVMHCFFYADAEGNISAKLAKKDQGSDDVQETPKTQKKVAKKVVRPSSATR